MTEETRARIFEPFFTTKPRARAPASGSPRCTGSSSRARLDLGLQRSRLGSTFKIYLPCVDAAVDPLRKRR